MIETSLPTPERALAIGAHPDDIEFGCGATLSKWAELGAEVHMMVLTDGSKGTWDPDRARAELIATREREQGDAARRLGVSSIRFLSRTDGELTSDLTNRAEVCRAIREIRPDVVLGHDPWKRYRLHPDHRHAGWLTVDGVVAARDPLFFPGLGGPHHRPDALLLFEADEPDHAEAVATFIPMKVAALLAHRSQWRSTIAFDVGSPAERDGIAAFERQIEDEARAAAPAGVDGFAEAFRVLTEI